MATDETIRIVPRYQGPTGSGQGGWTAARFAGLIGEQVTIALRAPIPLDTDLSVTADPHHGGRWLLTSEAGAVVMVADRWSGTFPHTPAVSIADAAAARRGFSEAVTDHAAPECFSCGLGPDTMRVHAGPLDDHRFATDWTVPDWAAGADGHVDPAVVWTALDCAAAWWAGFSGEPRVALTAQFTAEVVTPPRPGDTYAIVAWAGDHDPGWDGRKRHAASAAFDRDGHCIAHATSLWVSLP